MRRFWGGGSDSNIKIPQTEKNEQSLKAQLDTESKSKGKRLTP